MLFIVNPCAGKRRVRKYLIKILDIFNRADYDVHIITQNIDDLHERAGSQSVLHLHGEMMKVCSVKNPDNPDG